jgi:hypothetical protein
MVVNIKDIRYPHISHFYNVEPNIEAFLGRQLFIQEKLDGSNAGLYLDKDGEVQVRSRNNIVADGDMQKWMKQSGCLPAVKELLENAADWNDEYVLFGELYGIGKSPTRIKVYDKPFFTAFDLWTKKNNGFISCVAAHQQCHHFGIPFVETVCHGQFSTVPYLQAVLEDLLEDAKEKCIEGYVIKTWDVREKELNAWGKTKYMLPLMFKHKLDTPRLEKIMTVKDFNAVVLPVLSDSDIYGAIDRVKRDHSDINFKDIRVAMPLIAQYVGAECKQHNCRSPSNLHKYYFEVLKE